MLNTLPTARNITDIWRRSDASFVETVKLEITSEVNEALKSRAVEALKKGFAVDIVADITGLPVE